MNRRFFLFAAPAIVAAPSLMRVSAKWLDEPKLFGMFFGGDNPAIFPVVAKGSIFSATNGKMYVYNGTVWVPL